VLEYAVLNGRKERNGLKSIIGCNGMEEFVMKWKGLMCWNVP
jgi:hypothetical protein